MRPDADAAARAWLEHSISPLMKSNPEPPDVALATLARAMQTAPTDARDDIESTG